VRFSFATDPATFLQRPNRYVVVAETRSRAIVRAHCPDPGRLSELLVPGVRLHLSSTPREGRRTTHELRFVEHPRSGVLISLDSRLPNALFGEALSAAELRPFVGWSVCGREVPSPIVDGAIRSRVDYLLTNGSGARMWVEVKSATLVEDRCAYFPDAVTERGRRHVCELAALVGQGERCAVCFVVQRPDADVLRPQWERDPAFAQALRHAASVGVLVTAHACEVTTSGAHITRQIPVVTEPYASYEDPATSQGQ
jgi:sugar fermentation stimulation protein A